MKEQILTICREISENKYTWATGYRKIIKMLQGQRRKDLRLCSADISNMLKKQRVEEYKKGYNQSLRDQKKTGVRYQHLYL